MLKIGIVGLAQSGKTTFFRIVTKAHGAGLASGKPAEHVGVVSVPDERLDRLSRMFDPRRTVPATIEYVDTAGSIIDLARAGAQSAALREVQALALVIRAFDADSEARILRDLESVEVELILSDLAQVEKRVERLEKDVKKMKNPALDMELQTLLLCKAALEKQQPLRELDFTPDQQRAIRGFTFLSIKAVLFILNLSEKDAARTGRAEEFASAASLLQKPNAAVMAICGQVEAELAELPESEAAEFMASFGLAESAIARAIRASYGLLGLISFFTVGEDECRAWTIHAGATALDAAGEIHSDIQRGFIRAEVVGYEDLIACGSLAESRNRGKLRLEGKEYVVKDGEIVHFRHAG